MAAQVMAHPVAERLGAEMALQHLHHRRSLLIRQQVVHRLGIGREENRVLDGPGRRQGVDAHGLASHPGERLPGPPLRPVGVGAADLHEGGERLVEPDALPPLHGHEVAEPHVGQLVVDHVGHPLQLSPAGGCGIHQQQGLPEGHAAEVLHRPEGEVGHRHQVDLVAGVGDVVVLGKPAQRETGGLQRIAGEVSLAGPMDHPDRHAVDLGRLAGFEATHHESHQIGRHRHRRGEAGAAPAVFEDLAGGLGGVGDRQQVRLAYQGGLEDGLEGRLVPAGEGPAGVGGLELGGGDDVLAAVVVGIDRPVEAAEPVVEHAAEAQAKLGGPGLEAPTGPEVQAFCLFVDPVAELAGRAWCAWCAGFADLGAEDLQLGGVADDLVGALVDADADRDRALEGCPLDVGAHLDPVALGDDVTGQSVVLGGHCGAGLESPWRRGSGSDGDPQRYGGMSSGDGNASAATQHGYGAAVRRSRPEPALCRRACRQAQMSSAWAMRSST